MIAWSGCTFLVISYRPLYEPTLNVVPTTLPLVPMVTVLPLTMKFISYLDLNKAKASQQEILETVISIFLWSSSTT